MMYYSLNGGVPGPLPKSYLEANGTNHTALNERTIVQLAALGFVPADPEPAVDSDTHSVAWVVGTGWVTTAHDQATLDALLANERANRKADAASQFISHRDGGVSVDLGSGAIALATSHAAEQELSAAAQALGVDTIKVVTRAGLVISMSAVIATTARDAVRAHIRACQEREAALYEAIEAAADLAVARAVDIASGWPA